MRKLMLCVKTLASIAIRIPEWGYEAHGHDVEIEACFSSGKRVDIESLRGLLSSVVSQYDHKPLWETIGEGALIEDLLNIICEALEKRSPREAKLEHVEAEIPGARIIVYCT